MTATASDAFLELVSARRGHFELESGYHGGLWLDLDTLFSDPRRIAPFVDALTEKIRPHDVSVVCGPLLGGAFLAQLVATALGAQLSFTERVVSTEEKELFHARYALPPAYAALVRGRRVAIVDDVMSAGSSLRATYDELLAHEARPVVAGALLVLGSAGADHFTQLGMPVEAVARDSYELWAPASCPMCASGIPLDRTG